MVSRFGLVLAAALTLAGVGGAPAQTYPTRAVKILVSVPPGGAPDLAARIVAERLTARLGQPFVVENRPGSNGNIAGDVVAKSKPDGYTLILAQDSIIAINPALYANMSFDTLRDLAPIGSVARNEFVLSINPALPVRDFKEFIEHARKTNPPLPYASGGNGSQHQIAMEMLKQRAGINLVHVPYRGGAPATTATVAGETMAMFSGTSSAPQIKAGKLRGLAVTGAERSEAFPDLPAIAEVYPGYELEIWLGLFAPAGTPEPVVSRLRAELKTVLAEEEVRRRLGDAGGLEPFISTPEEFSALIRKDHERYRKLIAEVGIKVD